MGGMLPDIDIKTSRSFQDCMSITACIAAMMVILRVSEAGVSAEMISIIGTAVFLAIKFGVGRLIQSFTVHRGLIHSIPFCILCGEIIFLTMSGEVPTRVLKAAGLSLGFFSHLLLDEIFSVDIVKFSTKQSFGTAIKFGMRKQVMLTAVLYFLLFCATFVSVKQPDMVGEALDHFLDQVAELTIRGTRQFDEASSLARQKLRGTVPAAKPTDAPSDSLLAQDNGTPRDRQPITEEPSARRYPLPELVAIPIPPAITPDTTSLPPAMPILTLPPPPVVARPTVQIATGPEHSPVPLQRPRLLIEEM